MIQRKVRRALQDAAVQVEMSQEQAEAQAEKDRRLEELAQIITAYNDVTDKLQKSHETLKGEVLRLRSELASTNAQLQRSKRLSALGEMAAGIAHEIRNPLAAIQLYASMVSEDLDAEQMNRELAVDNTKKIVSAVRGLNGIVNDVLSFAREIEVDQRETFAGVLFDGAVAAHLPAIEEAGVCVKRDDAADELCVRVDGQLMGQVLLNLLRNAVDALAEADGDRVVRLDAKVNENEGVVSLIVADNGPGIDEQAVDRIFNPFFTTRNTGTGLGLAIVHRIVEAHAGGIVVGRDQELGGAKFELQLPLKETLVREQAVIGVNEQGQGGA